MITQSFLDTERELSRRIFGYYLDKVIGEQRVGERGITRWYKDCVMVNFLMKAIHALHLVDGEVYLGGSIVGDIFFKNAREKIREYLNHELRALTDDLGDDDLKSGTVPPPPLVVTLEPLGWASHTILVSYDGQTEVALPFDISEADVNSLMVTVNDHDPDSLTTPEQEGCHIIGSTLYWHNYYDLLLGDIIVIKYERIL